MNFMGDTLKFEYKFGAWQILLKTPFDTNIFLSHVEYGRIIITRAAYAVKESA